MDAKGPSAKNPPPAARKDLDKLRSEGLSDSELRAELWKRGYTQAQISGLMPEAPPEQGGAKAGEEKAQSPKPRDIRKKRIRNAVAVSLVILISWAIGCALYGLLGFVFFIGAGFFVVMLAMLVYAAQSSGGQATAVRITGDSLSYEVPAAERRRRLVRGAVPAVAILLLMLTMAGFSTADSMLLFGVLGLFFAGLIFGITGWPAINNDSSVKLRFSKGALEYEVRGKGSGSIALPDIGGFKTAENSPNMIFPDVVYRALWVMKSGEKISLIYWKGKKLLKLRLFCTPEDFEQIVSFINEQMAKRGRPLRETRSTKLNFEHGSTRLRIFSSEA